VNRGKSHTSDAAETAEFAQVYECLRVLAGRALRRERRSHTLQATALVHEAWIKLAGAAGGFRADHDQFMMHAARAVREVLVDHARRRARSRREGNHRRITLTSELLSAPELEVDLLDLDAALKQLAELHPRQARVIELRFFGGFSGVEVAATLGVAPRTVDGDWHAARAWLARELGRVGPRIT
jgi:RNA polymerase sigma factor (TIGR02999 family)